MCKYILILSAALVSFGGFAQESSDVHSSTETYKEQNETVNDTVKNKKGQILEDVIITSNQQKPTATVLRSGLKPIDTPQSLQVISAVVRLRNRCPAASCRLP
ncbi:hypothetical protein [Flavobacterium sp.]|uniref:hypothetical protein n=1 Tax=Flavobacterium sp. TaxID=239 RepID=UPI00260DFE25|nr:hypothetical protein [Flavobacterium sp.]